MKHLLDFIERHKSFIKKLILFTIYIIVIAVISSEPITQFFYKIFGEYITAAIKVVTPFTLVLTEV